jgi:adenylate cyclase
MFGNIGVPERLTFSVIGRTVNAAARIEAMTKELGRPLLVTADIAAASPAPFSSVGRFRLAGFGEEVELHAPL